MGLAGRSGARAITNSRYVNLAAVCDLSVDTVTSVATQWSVKAHTDYARMLDDPEIEAIYICTPTHLRLPHVERAVGAHKHVLVEKPIARNVEEAEQIVQLISSSDVIGMSVNTRGGDAPVQAMARIVADGNLGEVLSLTNVMYKPWVLSPRWDYEMDPTLGGGVNFRQAPHQVEIARTIIGGPVTAVTATVGHVDKPVASYGNFNALLQFATGATASLVFNGYGYYDTAELTWGIGEGGGLRAPGAGIKLRAEEAWTKEKYGGGRMGAATVQAAQERRGLSIYGLTIVSCEYGDLRPSKTGITVYDYDSIHDVKVPKNAGGLPVDFEQFYAWVRDGVPQQHDLVWGARTVQVCEAIWTSAQQGMTIFL